ncbi:MULTISPECIES: alpha/beta fold hydrolase [unclassified Rhodococcus (in: high G+C Gram-positive bacteria)]|uniref:alpha/beta fold hydrolase n=1 Tax=unclassified Rhodococcus (in: high G+C Gram-positive bacteria) TaxID=192944 RepID=UPI0016396E08|nr:MULTISPECIES: alpha/beta hydrolase [unclassified Rhodococcus (in: high G+C Gram-positive bacteria)]MBC2641617.1 alpha/beta hydrolase [Rhodococcus sp. 3A]MBC2893638.1 alpha/beta hydrolase [Rhodococcus sp. 4CII]
MAPPDPSTVRFDGPWIHRDIHANGIRFHTVEVGASAPDAPLVVLLHGFADFWWSWRHQLTALSDKGYRAVAVDLRGYGDSDKPPRGYDGWTLAGDIAGLIRAMGYGDATLVGHADGGLVCWATAVLHSRLVRSIALVSSPHPLALKQAVLHDRYQRKALLPSFVSCQVPWRPERRLTRDDGSEVERLIRARSGPSWTANPEFDVVMSRMRSAIQIPGTAHCTLEYQRWAFRSQFRPDGSRFMASMDQTLRIPVLHIHGDLDPYVLAETVRRSHRFAPTQQMHTVTGVGHYAHWEAPERVNAALLDLVAPRTA